MSQAPETAETIETQAAAPPAADVPPAAAASLLKTPLHALHVARGGRMVPFAGYEMPVQFPAGILKEHLHTRAAAGLFDVSHMGQAFLRLENPSGDADAKHAAISELIETLVPGEIKALKPGQIRYTLLLNDQGGIRDDLMVSRPTDPRFAGTRFLVVNAGTKDADFTHIAAKLQGRARLERLDTQALIALQGPKAPEVLERIIPGVAAMTTGPRARRTVGRITPNTTTSRMIRSAPASTGSWIDPFRCRNPHTIT
jgi:aminomethyltransferase